MEFIDLSYYKILPQQTGVNPKILVSEVTNEIEYLACTDTYTTTIDYVSSKIMEASGVSHTPVQWGTDLKFYESNYVTLTKFDLNKEWIYYGDSEKLDSYKNQSEIEFMFLLNSILGGGMWSEDVAGFADKNFFIKSFHYNTMFEVELAMYASGHTRASSVLDKTLFDHDDLFENEDDEVFDLIKPHVDKFLSVKKSDWFDILKFPSNSKFEKCKFWAIKKITNCQKIIKNHYQ